MYLRLLNVSSIEEANKVLPQLIRKFNTQFALQENNNKNVFEKQISEEKINLTLAILSRRTIDSGHSIKFKKKYYKLVNSKSTPIYFSKGTKCMVIEAYDKRLFATIDNNIFALEEIPEFQSKSLDFDNVEQTKQQYIYIPKMIHPWKAQSFINFVDSQSKKVELEKELVLAQN